MSSRFTKRQWWCIYLGICVSLLPVAGILAAVKPSEVVVIGVLVGVALIVPVFSLLGPVWRIPHAWVHVAMLFVLLFESILLAGAVNGGKEVIAPATQVRRTPSVSSTSADRSEIWVAVLLPERHRLRPNAPRPYIRA